MRSSAPVMRKACEVTRPFPSTQQTGKVEAAWRRARAGGFLTLLLPLLSPLRLCVPAGRGSPSPVCFGPCSRLCSEEELGQRRAFPGSAQCCQPHGQLGSHGISISSAGSLDAFRRGAGAGPQPSQRLKRGPQLAGGGVGKKHRTTYPTARRASQNKWPIPL